MGAIFKLEHANIMAYATSRSSGAPRVLRRHLHEYLEVLAYNPREYLVPERGFDRWPEEVAETARKALTLLEEVRSSDDIGVVSPAAVERVLDELRSEFSAYSIYALAVGADSRLRDEAQKLARRPMYGQMLVLIPIYDRSDRNFETLDPVPVFSRAIHSAPDWPGFLFWTSTGVSAFAPLDRFEELAAELEAAQDGAPRSRRLRPFPFPFPLPAAYDDVLRRWSSKRPTYRRLLHLSDLHFGTDHALQNQALLDGELREVVRTVDRVVITGDLFDSPRPSYATLFTNFRNNITHLARGREPIVIPGNHDQRMLGNVGRDFEQIASIGARKVVVDDDSEMIFACFNSSERGSFARGKIPTSQFRQLGGEYRTLTAARNELKRYLPIVLVHHHPFSFDVTPETWVQRALAAIGLREEKFLEMVNAGDLHQWCIDWDIRTILHGHKHKARYIEREVVGSDSRRALLTAIGCGSSLGAEGSPVSYNLLEWDATAQRWIASIFQSVNGGAFRETVAAISADAPVRSVDKGR